MTKVLTFLVLMLSLGSFSQKMPEKLKAVVDAIKEKSTIDRTDKTALHLLNDFYNQALEEDDGKLTQKTIQNLTDFMEAKEAKNKYLIVLFMMYQNHITQTASVGKSPNAQFQVDMMSYLKNEFDAIYGTVPPIIYVYLYEALNSIKNKSEAQKIIKEGLENYPDAVPLKVYQYIETKDEKLRDDLMTNHSKHWMVLQNRIK